jgi:hypothetical protein
MDTVLDYTWGPFLGPGDALFRLGRFVDRCCAPSVGIAWAGSGGLYLLRSPKPEDGGMCDVAIFHWPKLPPMPKPKPPPDFWDKVKAFLREAAIAQYNASQAEVQGDLAMSRAVGQVFDRMVHTHQDDGVGVALDVLCIALSIALIPTGIGIVTTAAGIAAIGGAALLVMDGAAYGLELSGADEDAEAFKKHTEMLRIAATIATLPDLLKGGYIAVKELKEVREALPLAEQTASSAERMASRARSSARADQYNQIAEKAHLRAQIRKQQIAGLLLHEIAPRISGVGSTGLLIREEIQTRDSLLHAVLSRLQVHTTSLKR